MSSNKKSKNVVEKVENLAKVLQISKAMQTRFTLIPKNALNKVTVAGIRDMSLGRMKEDGTPVGGNVIRFNNPSPNSKSDYSRICIDPIGESNKANLHIKVSPETIKAAEAVQNGLKITGKVLLVVSLIASGVRVGKSIYDEVNIDDEIESLEQIVSALEQDLTDETLSESRRKETRKALKYSKELLKQALDNKKYPGKKTLSTIVCIGGEYGGAAVGGLAGAKTGALVGAVGGPVGAFAGAVIGSIVGATVGLECGGSGVENFKCDSDGLSTELNGSLANFGKDVQGEVLGLKGNFSIGKDGLSTGVGGSLFELKEENKGNLSILKVGAKADINNNGVDIGVESKLCRSEIETDIVKVGFGINLDTGFKINNDGGKIVLFGFGFSFEKDGFSLKLPIFDIKLKK